MPWSGLCLTALAVESLCVWQLCRLSSQRFLLCLVDQPEGAEQPGPPEQCPLGQKSGTAVAAICPSEWAIGGKYGIRSVLSGLRILEECVSPDAMLGFEG